MRDAHPGPGMNMKKDKSTIATRQRLRYIIADYVAVNVAVLLFNIFRFFFIGRHDTPEGLEYYLMSETLVLEQIFFPIGMLIIYGISGYYNNTLEKSRLSELNQTVSGAVIGSLGIYLLALINDPMSMRRHIYLLILILALLLFGCTYAARYALTSRTISMLKKRKLIYSTLIIGNSPRSRRTYNTIKKSGSVWGHDVVGFLRIPGEKDASDLQKAWDLKDVEEICRRERVDRIIISPAKNSDDTVMDILNKVFPLDIPVYIEPDTLGFITSNIVLDDIMGLPMITLTSSRMSEWETNVKRITDIAVSAVALLLLSPVLGILAIAVKKSSEGPVFYRQERLGLRQKPFKIIKFRSMRMNAEENGPQLSNDCDTRVTRVGRFLRKYRLDELPQFWNVIKGDMSLVGPRPERAYFADRIVKQAPYYRLIHQVRPGITSWGMVKYGYASTVAQMVKRSQYDLLYINNMSLSMDIKIFIYTIRTVIKGSGV